MNKFNSLSSIAALPESINRLPELAYNVWWSWNWDAVDLFAKLDENLWEEVTRNPVKMLLSLQGEQLEKAANDPSYLESYRKVMAKFDQYMNPAETWFTKNYPDNQDQIMAYFSAEFGLHESLPIYAGGLGVLSGDHCKSASDLGLPFVALGLLYREGYFSQQINPEGWQESIYTPHNFYEMAMQEVKDENNNEVIVSVNLPGRKVLVKVWKIQVGRIPLYLLDTDIPENSEHDRKITSGLYGGNQETRIAQEILLGIAGVRALRHLRVDPSVWHMNEGHTAFLLLERARELVAQGHPFHGAWVKIQDTSIFTTHTPVPAGHDAFSWEMIDHYFGEYRSQLGLSREDFMRLALDSNNMFNMTVLAMKAAWGINGVSKLHGAVTRRMWWMLWPDLPEEQRPIIHITNGIHTETWLAPELAYLYDKYLPEDWRKRIEDRDMWEMVENIPAQELWVIHQQLKSKMVDRVRMRISAQRKRHGEHPDYIDQANHLLDPTALTIGFARRFATYKRATLIFTDMHRLYNILNNSERPVQIVFAGKAHPADRPGQEFIKRIYEISKTEGFHGKVIMLEDYNMRVARYLLHGVDVWLNNPRRPQEASGTSGEKAAANGILNFSILDGWWCEGYNGYNGWPIGHEWDYGNHDEQDQADSRCLYTTLEQVIIPLYYHQDKNGVPHRWVDRMKEAIKTVTPDYSTQRMVQDYTNKFYVPAASNSAKILQETY